jgi:hypothetical protein
MSVRGVNSRTSAIEIQADIEPIMWTRLKLAKIIETKPSDLGFNGAKW